MSLRAILWSAGGTTTPVAQITEAPAIRSMSAIIAATSTPVGRLVAKWKVSLSTISVTSSVVAMAQKMRAFAAIISSTTATSAAVFIQRGVAGVVNVVSGVIADIAVIEGAVVQAISAVIAAVSAPDLVARVSYGISCMVAAISDTVGLTSLIRPFSSTISAASAPIASTASIRTFNATITSPPVAVVNEYSREANAALPGGSGNLSTVYSAAEIADVATVDGTYVSQAAADQYAIHEFKNDVVVDYAAIVWNGQSTLACSSATVTLQIYNTNTSSWEVLDSDTTTGANTSFTLAAAVSGLTNYKSGNTITCRVFQHS